VEHPSFHVDYIDSDIENAIAIPHGGYSFIGLTVALMCTASDVCLALSKSQEAVALLRVQASDEEYNNLQAVLFYVLLAFIVGHEWTHHVHGNAGQLDATGFPNEVLDAGGGGSLDSQIKEIDADGYSAHHVLANLIDNPQRPLIAALKIDAAPANVQDEVMFAIFVVAVAAYLFVRPAFDLDRVTIYKDSHPPQAARMHFLMDQTEGWCSYNRPDLIPWMRGQFQSLMSATADAVLGKGGAHVWANQTAFLLSDDGLKYISTLREGFKSYVAGLLARA
jgi:hypothetical protein